MYFNNPLYHAGEAESGLERLHQCAEKELQVYLNAEGPSKDFNEFRTKLAGLTRLLYTEIFSGTKFTVWTRYELDLMELDSIATLFLTIKCYKKLAFFFPHILQINFLVDSVGSPYADC